MHAAVVTGTSTGIGWGIAKVLAQAGWQVFGSVRKEADAERLQGELGARFTPLIFDVTDEAAVKQAARQVGEALGGATLTGLVNNAGIAVPGPLLELGLEEVRRQMEVNLLGQLAVTQAFAPLLGTDRAREGPPGRIVMISSVGGRRGLPFLGPYAASKFALEGMSESLRRELMLFGIDVIVIGPAAIRSAIWDKAEAVETARYDNSPYRQALLKVRERFLKSARDGLPAERVGELVLRVLTIARPRVRYAITPDPFGTLVLSLLPRRQLDRLIARRLGWDGGRRASR